MFLKVSKSEELGQLYWTKLSKQRSIIQMWSAWVLGLDRFKQLKAQLGTGQEPVEVKEEDNIAGFLDFLD